MDTVVNGTREPENRSYDVIQSISVQLAALRQMTPAQLRDKYLEVFGEPTRSGNKDFLFKRLAWRIQSLTEGSLSERAKQRAAELACDADIRMTMPKPPATTLGAHPVSAYDVCRYIETLAHLVSSRSAAGPTTAESKPDSGESKERIEPATSPVVDSPTPADPARPEANINGLLDDANYCLTILGDLRRDFQVMHSASRRMEGGGEEWHFATSTDKDQYHDAAGRSRTQSANLIAPLGIARKSNMQIIEQGSNWTEVQNA